MSIEEFLAQWPMYSKPKEEKKMKQKKIQKSLTDGIIVDATKANARFLETLKHEKLKTDPYAQVNTSYGGLTKRELFAIHILSGLHGEQRIPLQITFLCKRALELTDALIEELNK